jgi:hypothetical protein
MPCLAARGEDVYLDIEGPHGRAFGAILRFASSRISVHLNAVAPPGGAPMAFADHWNAAQVLSRTATQLALAANSPFFLGKQLWAEIPDPGVQRRRSDTRSIELEEPRSAPARLLRRAVDHVDLRLVRRKRALLPCPPARDLRRGPGRPMLDARSGVPALARDAVAQRHRSIAGTGRSMTSSSGRPHRARREPRPARLVRRSSTPSPTAAFYYGTLRMLAQEDRPSVDADELCCGRGQLRCWCAARASTPSCTGLVAARSRRPSSCCATCLPLAQRGPAGVGCLDGFGSGALPLGHRRPVSYGGQWRVVAD